MKQKHPPIIAIQAMSKGFGYVVMSGPFSLVDWKACRAPKPKNANCLARITKLLDQHEPHTVVLEDRSREPLRSARINRLYQSIAVMCHSRSIDLAVFSRADMRSCYAMVGAKTWQEIAEAVARQLEPFRKLVPSRREAWQSESRAMSVFAAAAVAMTYWQLSSAVQTDFI